MGDGEILDGAGSDYSDATELISPIEMHGHKYHHSNKIYTPCDDSARDVEHILHEVFKVILHGGLTTVPLSTTKPLQILDLGTGTGLWALDMGLAYPLAQVTGIDISPVLLPEQMPRNVSFEVEDLETEDDDDRIGVYDLVHMRGLGPAGIHNWPAFFKRIYGWLKPGGWIEIAGHSLEGPKIKANEPAEMRRRWFCQINGTMPEPRPGESSGDDDSEHNPLPKAEDSEETPEALSEFVTAWLRSSERLGLHWNPEREASRWVLEAGFEKVTQVNEVIPLKLVGGDAASRHLHALFWSLFSAEGFEHFVLRYLTEGGHDEQWSRDIISQLAQDLQNTMVGVHGFIRFCSGRKPLAAA